ncbi:MAG: hypothetical protein AAFY17_09735 [Cyanobacteria bacterium J06642_11]
MAPKVSQLQTLPWSAFVGASVLMHIGVLSVGLPRLMQVGRPTGNSSNIPVSLVDETTSGSDTSANQPTTSQPTTSQPTTSQPTASQTVPQKTIPIDGQNNSATPPAQPAAPSTQDSAQTLPEKNQNSNSGPIAEQTIVPTPAVKAPIAAPPLDIAPPGDPVQPPSRSPEATEPVGAEDTSGETSNEQTARGPTTVTIESAESITELGGGSTQPEFSLPQTLSIPQNNCSSGVVPNSVQLKVEIIGNGEVISLKSNAGQLYDTSPQVITADCLFMTALRSNPSIRFTPTQPDIGENNPVNPGVGPSVAGQFMLRFE